MAKTSRSRLTRSARKTQNSEEANLESSEEQGHDLEPNDNEELDLEQNEDQELEVEPHGDDLLNVLSHTMQKRAIHEHKLRNHSAEFLALKYKVTVSYMSDILNNQKSILMTATKPEEKLKMLASSQREEQISFLDFVMYEYLQRALCQDIPIDDYALQEKAAEVIDCMALLKFEPSDEWLTKFKEKFAIKDEVSKDLLIEELNPKDVDRSSLQPGDMIRYVQQRKQIFVNAQKIHPTDEKQNKKSSTAEKGDDGDKDNKGIKKTYTINKARSKKRKLQQEETSSLESDDMSGNEQPQEANNLTAKTVLNHLIKVSRTTNNDLKMQKKNELKKIKKPRIVYKIYDDDDVRDLGDLGKFAVDETRLKVEIGPTELSEYHYPEGSGGLLAVTAKDNENEIATPMNTKIDLDECEDKLKQNCIKKEITLELNLPEGNEEKPLSEDDDFVTIYEVVDDDEAATRAVEKYTHSVVIKTEKDLGKSETNDEVIPDDSITIKKEPLTVDDDTIGIKSEAGFTKDVIIKTETDDIKQTEGFDIRNSKKTNNRQLSEVNTAQTACIEDDKSTIDYEKPEQLIMKNNKATNDHEQYLPVLTLSSKGVRSSSPLPEIDTMEEAMKHLKVLENYVMMRENFRAIGLITQLEAAINETN